MLTLFVVLLTCSTVVANPFSQEATPSSNEQKITPIADDLNVDEYLRRYGYMTNDVNERSGDYAERRTNAIKSFQEFAGLEVTGVTDEETRELMLKPRCGMRDIEIGQMLKFKWNVSEVTYRILSYTKDISKENTREVIRGALTLWEAPSRLTFKKVTSGKALMEIKFARKKHPPCPDPLDGLGRELAHAYYPTGHPFGGDIHFDDDETFKYKKGKGYKLDSIALHESGHALGLTHDKTKGSVMIPWYNGQTTLGPNDIERMEDLYA